MHPTAPLFAFVLSSLTCSWSFPGGTPATSASCQPPPVVFSRTGPVRVTLEVCAGTLCNSASQAIDILEPKPRILRVVPSPQAVYADEPVTLTAEATGKPALSFSWQLPDGSSLSGNPVVVPPGRLTPTRATVRLTVANQAGSAARTLTPRILSPSPSIRSASLSPNPAYPRSELTASADANGRPPLGYRWTFPGGQVLEGASVTWAVPDLPARSYDVVLDVSNRSGSVSSRRSLRVLPDAVLRGFDPVCSGPCIFRIGQAVRFVITTTLTNPRFDVDWNGDGVYEETVTSREPSHTYYVAGFFRPRIRVRLPNGRQEVRYSSRFLTITFWAPAP